MQAHANKAIKNNNKIIGYEITDGKSTMSINTQAILNVMKAGKITFDNLHIDASGTNLVMDIPEDQKKLTDELNKAREVYEQGTDEIMPNREYDAKYDQLKDMEKKSGIIAKDSPTVNVGYSTSGSKLQKYTFKTPMLSLEKTKSVDDLKTFIGNQNCVLSTKMDGLTVVLQYMNGQLYRAITRGNGEVGEIVTENAKRFVNVPQKINYTGKMVLRGEAVIKYSDFEKLNVDGAYKNPRNLCSGSVRQLDPNVTASRKVNWFCFDLVEADGMPSSITYHQQLDFLKSLGFSVVPHTFVNASTVDQQVINFTTLVKADDIPADGLVIKYDNIAYGLGLGRTAKAPKYAIAFKWEDGLKESELIDVVWQVGRTGKITPVAVFKPVEIEGSIVQRASLHNLSMLNEILGQPYVGEKVYIYKANMIIPQIAQADRKADLRF